MLRRAVKNLAIGPSHGLEAFIHDEKNVVDLYRKLSAQKIQATESFLRWANSLKNPFIKELSKTLTVINQLLTRTLSDFTEQYDLYRKGFKDILASEKDLEEMKKEHELCKGRQAKLWKQLEHAEKKGDTNRLVSLKQEVAKAIDCTKESYDKLSDRTTVHEAFKVSKARDSVLMLCEACDIFHNRCLMISASKRQLVDTLLSHGIEDMTAQNFSLVQIRCSGIVSDLVEALQLPRPQTPCENEAGATFQIHQFVSQRELLSQQMLPPIDRRQDFVKATVSDPSDKRSKQYLATWSAATLRPAFSDECLISKKFSGVSQLPLPVEAEAPRVPPRPATSFDNLLRTPSPTPNPNPETGHAQEAPHQPIRNSSLKDTERVSLKTKNDTVDDDDDDDDYDDEELNKGYVVINSPTNQEETVQTSLRRSRYSSTEEGASDNGMDSERSYFKLLPDENGDTNNGVDKDDDGSSVGSGHVYDDVASLHDDSSCSQGKEEEEDVDDDDDVYDEVLVRRVPENRDAEHDPYEAVWSSRTGGMSVQSSGPQRVTSLPGCGSKREYKVEQRSYSESCDPNTVSQEICGEINPSELTNQKTFSEYANVMQSAAEDKFYRIEQQNTSSVAGPEVTDVTLTSPDPQMTSADGEVIEKRSSKPPIPAPRKHRVSKISSSTET